MNREEMDRLRGLAEGANKRGKWTSDGAYVIDEEIWMVCTCADRANSAYIAAAHPGTVIALLDEIARLETAHALVCDSLAKIQDELIAPLQRENCELEREAKVMRRALDLVDEGDDSNVAEECIEFARAIIEQEEGDE